MALDTRNLFKMVARCKNRTIKGPFIHCETSTNNLFTMKFQADGGLEIKGWGDRWWRTCPWWDEEHASFVLFSAHLPMFPTMAGGVMHAHKMLSRCLFTWLCKSFVLQNGSLFVLLAGLFESWEGPKMLRRGRHTDLRAHNIESTTIPTS